MAQKGLSDTELIALGDIHSSSHPFTQAVQDTLPTLDSTLQAMAGDRYAEAMKNIQPLLRSIQRSEIATSPRGFGYLASSLRHDAEREVAWTAFIHRLFSDNGCHPLIIPIDTFLQYVPFQGFVGKAGVFTLRQIRDDTGKPYVLLLSDFSSSKIFDAYTLNRIPSQKNAGLDVYKTMSLGDRLLCFSSTGQRDGLPAIMDYVDGDITKVFEHYSRITGDDPRITLADQKLLTATALLLGDRQTWQNLWYEQKEGVPLYIVAPTNFHDAMNRLNQRWGHGIHDYSYRASCSLGARDTPIFDNVEGTVLTKDEIKRPNYADMGISQAEFEARVGPLLEKITGRE